MYRIVNANDGTEIGITDHIQYIKISDAGCFIESEQSLAVGIALNGTPYNLFGKNEIENADTIVIVNIDGGKSLFQCEQENAELKAQLAQADITAIELYEAHAEQIEINTVQDNTLIELYEMIGG